MSPPTPVARIDHWIGAGSFIQAYRALLLGLEAPPGDDVLLAASSRLASALRSRGWSLKPVKATEQSEDLHETEALPRLNGEKLYGTAPDDAPPRPPDAWRNIQSGRPDLPAPVAVSRAAHAFLRQCPACDAWWLVNERETHVIGEDEARRTVAAHFRGQAGNGAA